jgi:putative membrane protein
MLAAILSALHVLALAIGLPAVYLRGRALRAGDVAAVLRADNAWGIAAILWWTTGPLRAFGGFEKGTDWYLDQPLFHVKLGLFGVAALLELLPMVTFIRWRMAMAKGGSPDVSRLGLLYRINSVEVAIVLILPFVAAMLARGIGS